MKIREYSPLPPCWLGASESKEQTGLPWGCAAVAVTVSCGGLYGRWRLPEM